MTTDERKTVRLPDPGRNWYVAATATGNRLYGFKATSYTDYEAVNLHGDPRGTEFDELSVGGWLHVERLGKRAWYIRLGDDTILNVEVCSRLGPDDKCPRTSVSVQDWDGSVTIADSLYTRLHEENAKLRAEVERLRADNDRLRTVEWGPTRFACVSCDNLMRPVPATGMQVPERTCASCRRAEAAEAEVARLRAEAVQREADMVRLRHDASRATVAEADVAKLLAEVAAARDAALAEAQAVAQAEADERYSKAAQAAQDHPEEAVTVDRASWAAEGAQDVARRIVALRGKA